VFHFDLPAKKKSVAELEKSTYDENFWKDQQNAQNTMQKIKNLKEQIETYEKLKNKVEDLNFLYQLMLEEDDYTDYDTVEKTLAEIEKEVEEFKISTLLNGEYDENNAILSIHAGAGGLEAQDWAQMLLRMYRRWAEDKGYKVETLDLLQDPEAGIKSVTLLISGYNAYGYLKGEKGVLLGL
jgi:bacterial peptide chain release factor 2 (bRF-2)